jgi:hypothetical protein
MWARSIRLGKERPMFNISTPNEANAWYGQRSRVWAMPADIGDQKPMAPGKPMSEAPRASVTYTHYEIRVLQGGVLIPIAAEHCDTLSQAQESAARRCRQLGYEEYFMLEPPDKLEAQKEDGVYLCVIETVHHAVSV